jgi:hypothetical protein
MFKTLFGKIFSGNKAGSGLQVALDSLGNDAELDFLLIGPSSTDIVNALEGWSWLLPDGLVVVAVSAFGDVFFRSKDGVIQFLDTIEGQLKPVASDLLALRNYLQTEEGRDQLLLGGLVIGARNRGMVPASGDCYDFKVAPAIGGPISVDAMHTMSFLVKVHIAGQLHRQIHDLPPGTRISGFTYVS